MTRIYALVAALMGTFAQVPAPTTPSVPVRVASSPALATDSFADARVVVLAGDWRTRQRALAGILAETAAVLAVPTAWASAEAAWRFADRLVPAQVRTPRVVGYQVGDAAASHDAILRFVYEADAERARPVEQALQAGSARALADVARALDGRRRGYAARAGRHAFEVARRHLANLEQLAALDHARSRGGAEALAAGFDADNLKWLADHEAGDVPLVVWAA